LATTFFPRSYRAPGRLGDAQRAAGDSTGALASYRRALELNPRATEADRAAAAAIERKISGQPPLSDAASQSSPQRGTIAFVSTRHDSTADPVVDPVRAFHAAEIYLMNGDGSDARRITNNAYGDGFPSLSPDGRSIVFDSNRLRKNAEALNTSDLFVMNSDGTDQRALVRGSSASW
jgi:dipeptidyl aminopeptidase/acylaminoacyl peptidase